MKGCRMIVDLKSIFESPQWKNSNARLPLVIGKDENGEVVVLDLTEQDMQQILASVTP